MLVTKITENFYQLTDVFPEKLLTEILNRFNDKSTWAQLPDARNNLRLECHLHLTEDKLSQKIYKALRSIIEDIELSTGKLYQNSPQLWYDPNKYISLMHKDYSPNLTVNMQIYLADGNTNMGTHYVDNDKWYSVPYQRNCGYVLISPTQLTHGMKYPVTDQRLSLYQSFRSTIDCINDW
jgi:YesN/AraC family two-component response regulator